MPDPISRVDGSFYGFLFKCTPQVNPAGQFGGAGGIAATRAGDPAIPSRPPKPLDAPRPLA
ncbi:hypothetical protein [Roseivivax isoporae]|uniref:hypothetical protein n=1 Tax=Roseivivax isoporae TaxID=591206 RepID=UPI001B7FD4F7|nr:hypothetical protein [Roseivivax isoporae]